MIQNEWSCGQFKLEANNSMVSVVRGASKFLHLVVQRLPIDTHISKLTNGYPYHTSFPKFPTCLIMPLLKTPSQNPMPVLVQLIKWNRHLDILTFRLPIHGLTKLHRGSWDFRCILLISITWVLPKHWQQWKMKVNRVPCTKMNRLSIFNCRFFFFLQALKIAVILHIVKMTLCYLQTWRHVLWWQGSANTFIHH